MLVNDAADEQHTLELARTHHSLILIRRSGSQQVVIKQCTGSPRMWLHWHAEVRSLMKLRNQVRGQYVSIEHLGMLTTAQTNIANILAADEQALSLVLRYEDGKSLDILVNEHQMSTLSPDLGASIFSQMAGALTFVHAQEILHDDVKPANIIWSYDSRRAVLIDFGASQVDLQFTESGTPPYAAPEFLQRMKSYKSDVWALGITMTFGLGYIALPSGDWLLPAALQDGTREREDMESWISSITNLKMSQLEREYPALAKALEEIPERRLSSDELRQRLSSMT